MCSHEQSKKYGVLSNGMSILVSLQYLKLVFTYRVPESELGSISGQKRECVDAFCENFSKSNKCTSTRAKEKLWGFKKPHIKSVIASVFEIVCYVWRLWLGIVDFAILKKQKCPSLSCIELAKWFLATFMIGSKSLSCHRKRYVNVSFDLEEWVFILKNVSLRSFWNIQGFRVFRFSHDIF